VIGVVARSGGQPLTLHAPLVIGADGLLEQFLHVGMAEDAVQAIGGLPKGRGVLGALIDDPKPIRLPRIAEDPRSSENDKLIWPHCAGLIWPHPGSVSW